MARKAASEKPKRVAKTAKSSRQTLRTATIKEMANRLNPYSPYYDHEENKSPHFAVFLGAGASIESGIPDSNGMISDFIQTICAVECPKIKKDREKNKWLKANNYYGTESDKYGSLFEKCFPTEVDRREYIESKVDGKVPSLGYIALAHLIKRKIIDTIITTNFDEMIYIGCTSYTDIRPVVYSLGNFASEISGTTNRPRVLKLHGDFLFSRLVNTENETQNQDPNMSQQVQQVLETYRGLIVIGHSGNDDSIIKLLSTLPEGKYFYWCIYKNDKVGKDVENLIKEKKGWIVKIEGFDKLINEIRETVGIKDEDIFNLFEERREKLEVEVKKFNPKTYREFESVKLLLSEGQNYHINENYDRAEEIYNHALKINPKSSTVLGNLANIAEIVELNPAKAEKLYRKAIEYDPYNYLPYNNLALILIKQSKFEEARVLLEKALELTFFPESVYLSLACLCKKTGDSVEMENWLSSAMDFIFDEEVYELACFHAIAENKDQAIKFLKRSIKKEPFRRTAAKTNPKFDWIRNDSRFKRIAKE